MLIALNKPFDVLSQFTDACGRATLADFVPLPGIYPAGRLDRDSEGLLLLTDEPRLARALTSKSLIPKTYCVQVEGTPSDAALHQLTTKVVLNDGPARALSARRLEEPVFWPRHPPIRFRAAIPTAWIEIIIDEGRNRQVRRMTAAVGLPTLRLVRTAIGSVQVDGLASGQWRALGNEEILKLLSLAKQASEANPRRHLTRSSRDARMAPHRIGSRRLQRSR